MYNKLTSTLDITDDCIRLFNAGLTTNQVNRMCELRAINEQNKAINKSSLIIYIFTNNSRVELRKYI